MKPYGKRKIHSRNLKYWLDVLKIHIRPSWYNMERFGSRMNVQLRASTRVLFIIFVIELSALGTDPEQPRRPEPVNSIKPGFEVLPPRWPQRLANFSTRWSRLLGYQDPANNYKISPPTTHIDIIQYSAGKFSYFPFNILHLIQLWIKRFCRAPLGGEVN